MAPNHSAPISGETYRRLPGRRRALGSNSSLWMGSDHILLVKSAWFREEYKRFYLRDIQAIVVAPGPRFYVSTPMLLFALLWLLPAVSIAFWPVGIALVWGIATLAMAVTWLSISLASSCRCRLYTAVSKDELPSLYRTWTAQRFLNQVKPRIDHVQGALQAGWAEAERTVAGPASSPAALATQSQPSSVRRAHTLASDLFVLSLFLGALVGFGAARSTSASWFRVNSLLNLLQLAGAIAVLIQYYRGTLQRGLQRLAVVALVLIGVMFYAEIFVYSMVNSFADKEIAAVMTRPAIVIERVANGVGLLLGFIGAALTLRRSARKQADIIKD